MQGSLLQKQVSNKSLQRNAVIADPWYNNKLAYVQVIANRGLYVCLLACFFVVFFVCFVYVALLLFYCWFSKPRGFSCI